MIIIFINGPATVGKDTFMLFCKRACKGKAKMISLADKPKAALSILGWNGEKTEDTRKMLSDFKNMADKEFDMSNRYIKETLDQIKKLKNKPLILFISAREPKDIESGIQYLRSKGKKCTSLLIEREGVDPITSNIADAQVLNYKYENSIKNDGTLDELEEKAKEFVRKILEK